MIVRVDVPEGDAGAERLKELRAARASRRLTSHELSELDSLEARMAGRADADKPHLLGSTFGG